MNAEYESTMNADGVSGGAEAIVAPPKTKRNTKSLKTVVKKVSRSPSPIAPVAVAVVAEVAESKTLAEIVAHLQQIATAQEERIASLERSKQSASPPKAKGYYQVADGDEELFRTRIQNANLRKEIEAKTKTNQQLQQQLEQDPNELTRLKEINKALRKENEGLTNTNKALKAQMSDPESETERLRQINKELRKDAEAQNRLKLQYKTEKTVMATQMAKLYALLAENGIAVSED